MQKNFFIIPELGGSVCVFVVNSNRWCWSHGQGAVKAGSRWDSEAVRESELGRCCLPQQRLWSRGHSQGPQSSRKRPATPYWSHLFRWRLQDSADPAGSTGHLVLPLPPPGQCVARDPRANPCQLEWQKQKSLLKRNSDRLYSWCRTQICLTGCWTPWPNHTLIETFGYLKYSQILLLRLFAMCYVGIFVFAQCVIFINGEVLGAWFCGRVVYGGVKLINKFRAPCVCANVKVSKLIYLFLSTIFHLFLWLFKIQLVLKSETAAQRMMSTQTWKTFRCKTENQIIIIIIFFLNQHIPHTSPSLK